MYIETILNTDQLKSDLPRKIIAIDGYDASGKTLFAQKVSKEMTHYGVENRLISIDDFHFPKEKRYAKGVDSAVGFYVNSYNYTNFIVNTLKPFKRNLSKIFSKIYDLKTESTQFSIMEIPKKCVLIVEGIFLQRDELRQFWDLKIYLKINEQNSLNRNLVRKFGNEIPYGARERFFIRYICGQRLYHNEIRPENSADYVIDNSDL